MKTVNKKSLAFHPFVPEYDRKPEIWKHLYGQKVQQSIVLAFSISEIKRLLDKQNQGLQYNVRTCRSLS